MRNTSSNHGTNYERLVARVALYLKMRSRSGLRLNDKILHDVAYTEGHAELAQQEMPFLLLGPIFMAISSYFC